MQKLCLCLLMMSMFGCSTTTSRKDLTELPTVSRVDIERYLGTWYEIGAIPQSFQKGCHATTATYKKRDDGKIRVINRCRKGSLEGKEKVAKGVARSVSDDNSKLKVSFFRPFWGDYWIVELGDNYEYAVVGHPSRDYLWVLSRTPTMDEQLYQNILQRLSKLGYDTERIVKTEQPPA